MSGMSLLEMSDGERWVTFIRECQKGENKKKKKKGDDIEKKAYILLS